MMKNFLMKIENLNDKLNTLKNELQIINELLKEKDFEIEDSSSQLRFKEMFRQIKEFMEQERNVKKYHYIQENIALINNQFAEIEQKLEAPINKYQDEKNEIIEIMQSLKEEIEVNILENDKRIESGKVEREQTQLALIDEMNATFNKIYSLVYFILYKSYLRGAAAI